jgi:iron complex transport system ATP-binding protein
VSAPALAARAAGFAYRDGHGIADIDLEAGAGEIVGVVGPNGAGKSTLVKTLAGVLAPYRGSIRLQGAELAGLARREVARRLAVVPQESPAELPFTALETVLLGRHPHLTGLAFESEDDFARARAALERVGAGALAGRPHGELSSGERQRVTVARALAQETPVLLLDEPTSFLDLRYQVEVFDLLRALAGEGRAVVAVLHDLNLAAEYCDRLVLVAGGRVLARGPTAEVLTYAHLTAAYGTEVYVDLNDLTGALVVTPLSARARERLRGA